MKSAIDALSILYCFLGKAALTTPAVKVFDTSGLTTS
jgi:hypothetical protein